MTDQQIKAASLKHEKEASFREHQERKRSNKANEAIGRTNAAANVAKAFTSPFKFKLNHIEWYSHNVDSLKAVASLPYTILQGSNYVLDSDAYIKVGLGGWNIIRYVDTLPILSDTPVDASSPANLLAQSVFAHLRSKVSGSIGFESADYFMYIMAIGSSYALYAYLCNISKLLNYEPKDSLIKTRDIVTKLGLNWDSLNANKLWFTALINELGSVISNFALPRDFDYFKRKIWLTSNVFCEEGKELGNKYIFRPEGFMRYQNGILDFVPFGGSAGDFTDWNINQIAEYINTFRNMMSSNHDWITMSGQTQRAYGSDIFTFPSISVTDPLSLVEDLDILNQIKGATIAPHPLTLTITQITDPDSPNYGVIYQGTSEDGLDYKQGVLSRISYGSYSYLNGVRARDVIYSPEDTVTYEDIVRSTRLACQYEIDVISDDSTYKANVQYKAVSTEMVTGIDILSYTCEMDGIASNVVAFTIEHPQNASVVQSKLYNLMDATDTENMPMWKIMEREYILFQIANNLKFCPKFEFFVLNATESSGQYISILVPSVITHRFVPINIDTLCRINRIACNSLFGVYDNLNTGNIYINSKTRK